ncbi:TIGR03086 family metal-binding protein [Saxibacter everestensis]|uniref:TIGR03086 family metal-binding protein n=1 Tax=Saxibacter everestensis TaxID=2909229 RepID=A0ABY8QTU2_9MICO|nr:TIGR03086 family metal-binding protein [Brevibacteriaceae bacterium ZFBP1038]
MIRTGDVVMLDLEPASRSVAALLPQITQDQLDARTPCERYAVRDLLGHLIGLTTAFRLAARKEQMPDGGVAPDEPVPVSDAEEWQPQLSAQLSAVAAAWQVPDAWDGMAEAGGVTLPADIMGAVALNELVVHGWDLARATGQHFNPGEDQVQASFDLLSQSTDPADREPIYGPVITVDESAPLLDRVIGLAGRNPSWAP